MASIFDQYESHQQVLPIKNSGPTSSISTTMATSLFRNLKLEEDPPIFSKQRINFLPSNDIVQFVVNNNKLVLAMTNNVLIRIDLLKPQDLEEIDLTRYCNQSNQVYKLFLDASGQHLLVSLCKTSTKLSDVEAIDCLYIPWTSKKAFPITKLKGNAVSSVAWSQRNTSDTLTGPVIVGTVSGKLLEMELSQENSMFQSGMEPYCKLLYTLAKAEEVSGVQILPCPTDDLEYVLLCSTRTRLYTFRGKIPTSENRPLFSEVFLHYKESIDNYVEYKGSINFSSLKLYHEPTTMLACSFAWTNAFGVYFASVDWSKAGSNIASEEKLLKVTRDSGSSELLSQVSVGLLLTPFHVLLPHDNEVSVVSVVSEKVLMNDRISGDCGEAVGITQDVVKGTIWLYTKKGIFKCKMDREDRNVWKAYLDQEKFELARKYCQGDELKLLQVRMREAEVLLENGDSVGSAKLYAHTLVPFEQVFFKLNNIQDDSGLRVYLVEKLETLNEEEKGQFSLITLVLLEHYFKTLGLLRDAGGSSGAEYQKLSSELENFLKKPRVLKTLEGNRNAVYHLLSCHADQSNIIKISGLIKAYDRVIKHLINTNRHMEALEVLSQHSSEALLLEHLPTLLRTIPIPTVEFMMSLGHKLDPIKMVPILVQAHASKRGASEIRKYLEYCINELDRTDSVLHNFLITIYASEYPSKLLPYLKLQGENLDSVYYDTKLALRECMSAKQDDAAVHILSVMGLHQEAVELALKTNLDLAKATADKQRNNPQVCKKLWLVITKHLVEESQDVEKALEIMRECELIKIEDILPFFPDFVTIDLFKDAICESLKEYNDEIEALKREMNDASCIADEMRADVQLLKQEHTTVNADDLCYECKCSLLDRPFYLFQCEHKYHQDCLTEAVMNYLTPSEKHNVLKLRSRLLALSSEENRSNRDSAAERVEVRNKLDDIVAFECLYCGERIVDCIDKPFIPDESWRQVLAEWN